MGPWVTSHKDNCFAYEVGLLALLLWAKQEVDMSSVKKKLANISTRLCGGESLRLVNTLMGMVTGADIGWMKLKGFMAGATMCIGQPDLIFIVSPEDNEEFAHRDVSDNDEGLVDLVESHAMDVYSRHQSNAWDRARAFEAVVQVFTEGILGWNTEQYGMFGKTIAFAGMVGSCKGNNLGAALCLEQCGRAPRMSY